MYICAGSFIEMRLLFVEKSMKQVEKICGCEPNEIQKFLKIDDFNYTNLENSDIPIGEQIYYGYDINYSLLTFSSPYTVCIPGHGKFFCGDVEFSRRKNKIEISLMGEDDPLNIPDNAIVIISHRGM